MEIELGYGLVTCQRHPDQDAGWTPLYAEALELAELSEACGLASIWVSEHHFVGDGHLPALLPMLAAMAARTTRIKVGTALLLAPLYDPLRLIEDAHVVDSDVYWGASTSQQADCTLTPPRERPQNHTDVVGSLQC